MGHNEILTVDMDAHETECNEACQASHAFCKTCSIEIPHLMVWCTVCNEIDVDESYGHPHYFKHTESGEVYVILIGENGLFGLISGPIPVEEQTEVNLSQNYFTYLNDNQNWHTSTSWLMVDIKSPNCDCDEEYL